MTTRKRTDPAEAAIFYDMPVSKSIFMRVTKDGVIKVKEGMMVLIFTPSVLPPPLTGAKK